MNWKTIENVAKSMASGATTATKQFYYNTSEIAALLGSNPKYVTAFLIEKSVPYYCVGKSKIYFLPEVLEAVEGTRWTDKRGESPCV